MRDDFYEAMKPMAKVRNVCLHSDPDWGKHVTPEIAILKGLDLFGLQVAEKSGEVLKWEPHLEPQCTQMCAVIEVATSEMRTTWNMHFASCVENLIRDGKIKRHLRQALHLPPTPTKHLIIARKSDLLFRFPSRSFPCAFTERIGFSAG